MFAAFFCFPFLFCHCKIKSAFAAADTRNCGFPGRVPELPDGRNKHCGNNSFFMCLNFSQAPRPKTYAAHSPWRSATKNIFFKYPY
jgi:hypothetical protein